MSSGLGKSSGKEKSGEGQAADTFNICGSACQLAEPENAYELHSLDLVPYGSDPLHSSMSSLILDVVTTLS